MTVMKRMVIKPASKLSKLMPAVVYCYFCCDEKRPKGQNVAQGGDFVAQMFTGAVQQRLHQPGSLMYFTRSRSALSSCATHRTLATACVIQWIGYLKKAGLFWVWGNKYSCVSLRRLLADGPCRSCQLSESVGWSSIPTAHIHFVSFFSSLPLAPDARSRSHRSKLPGKKCSHLTITL